MKQTCEAIQALESDIQFWRPSWILGDSIRPISIWNIQKLGDRSNFSRRENVLYWNSISLNAVTRALKTIWSGIAICVARKKSEKDSNNNFTTNQARCSNGSHGSMVAPVSLFYMCNDPALEARSLRKCCNSVVPTSKGLQFLARDLRQMADQPIGLDHQRRSNYTRPQMTVPFPSLLITLDNQRRIFSGDWHLSKPETLRLCWLNVGPPL